MGTARQATDDKKKKRLACRITEARIQTYIHNIKHILLHN
jgi:phenylpyruvate tautomerase PptA (4-oxalocrotonate tautomerase family)